MRILTLIPTLLLLTSIAHAADPLQNLQWGLQNTGQTIQESYTDLESRMIKGKPGIDIQSTQARQMLKAQAVSSQRPIIVAVIDSGADVEHPDLKDHLYVNSADCDSTGKIPFQPQVDKDGNGYNGDCMGWNVTDSGDENRPIDDTGHGTHVAGIIAAVAGNGIGIEGAGAPQVRIMPIKVTWKDDKGMGLALRMTKAVKYATDMHADIINLSLGWPSSADTQDLRDSLKNAVDKGIIIVAAAGNNTTDQPIFPCAVSGVICVGSIAPDGSLSAFSNYGGHVDLLAPGSQILSLIPTQISPEQFSLRGYDYKTGTSQAAPFVSAAFSVLKAMRPTATRDELTARLMLASLPRPKENSSLGGLVQVDRALSLQAQPAVFPDLKGDAQVDVDPSTGSFSFDLPIQNLWAPSQAVSVTLQPITDVELTQTQFSWPSIQAGQAQVIKVQGRMRDLTADHHLRLRLTLQEGTTTRTAIVSKTLVIVADQLLSHAQTQRLDLSMLPSTILTDKTNVRLATVRDQFQVDAAPEFYFTASQVGQVSQLVLLRPQGSGLATSTLALQTGETVLNLVKIDLNLDGRPDYYLMTLVQSADGKAQVELYYLNGDLKPIFDFKSWSYDISVALMNWRDLGWTSTSYKGKKMLVPLFMNRGVIAPADKETDPFQNNDDTANRQRLYYLTPSSSGKDFQARSLDSAPRVRAWGKQMGFSYPDSINLRYVIPQSPAEIAKGEVQVILEIAGQNLRYYRMTVGPNMQVKAFERIQGTLDLRGFEKSRQPGVEAGSQSLFLARTQSNRIVEFAELRGTQAPRFYSYTHKTVADNIIGPVAASSKNGEVRLAIETKTQLVTLTQDSSGHQRVSLNPINRSSLLPGSVFSELFAPVSIGSELALYIDASALYMGHVYTVTSASPIDQAKIENSLRIPSGCSALNPWIQDGKTFATVFCNQNGTRTLSYLPLK